MEDIMAVRKTVLKANKSAIVRRRIRASERDFERAPVRGIEDRSIGTLMRLTLAGLRDKLKKLLAAQGVPWSVWPFVRALWDEDQLSQRELTQRVGLRQPTTVSAVRTAVRLGLVRLRRDDKDRRKVFICLTDKGKRLKDKLLPDVIVLNERIALKDFSDKEAAELKRLLLKMHRNLAD
jgi:DNA-binding MarR family transcriptional regulator